MQASGAAADPEAGRSAADGLVGRRRFAAIVAVSLGTMLTSIDNGSVNIALPTIARDLDVPASAAVLVITVYQLLLIMTVLPLSALGDRIGHHTLFQGGQILFIVTTLLCFFVQDLPLLILVRALQALGAAATFSVSATLIRSIYPQARLGRGIALNTVIAATSASIAPTIGGLILSVARWPWLFALCVPIGIASLLIGRKALPAPRTHREPYDLPAALMCAAMFAFAVVGLETAVHGRVRGVAAGLVIFGIALGIVFVRRESRQARPILPVDLLRDKRLALASFGSLCASIGHMIVLITLPFRLQHSFGYSPVEAGLVLTPWPVVMLLVAPAAGVLSDRISAGWLGIFGMTIAMAGMTSLAFLPTAPDHFDLAWRIALAALGYGLFYSPTARQIVGSAPLPRAAAAGALVQTIRMTGQVLGATGAAALLAGGIGTEAASPLAAVALAAVAGCCCIVVIAGSRKRHAQIKRANGPEPACPFETGNDPPA